MGGRWGVNGEKEGKGRTIGMKATIVYMSENTVMMIPQARIACVGRRSIVAGHNGRSHSCSVDDELYSTRESAETPVTAAPRPRDVIETARRARRVHCEILVYLAAWRSSVV